MKLWSRTLVPHNDEAPFTSHRDLYNLIDALPGGPPWESFTVSHDSGGEFDAEGQPSDHPSWMNADFEVWYRDPQGLVRDILANRSFADEFDYAPYHEYDHGRHCFGDFMSGDWAWRQAVSIFHQILSNNA